ncbi:MAG: hypothetical protein FJ125_05430 [Deltaproteobacteria bacterium]|nr:hypothetical protein [Deltaproteobacteria bacterium]
MESFRSAEEEVLFLFGQHMMDQALKKGPEYFVKRLNQREFREALRGLRARVGPERARFSRSLPLELAGPLIHAMLDSERWDRLVLESAVDKLPDPDADGSRSRRIRPVQRRQIRTSKLDRQR